MSVIWQQRTHGIQRRREAFNSALARMFLGVVVAATLLGALYLNVIGANVRLSGYVWELEENLGLQQRQNQALMVEIARLSSIPVLQQRSIALGFAPAENVHFLVIPEP